MKHSPTSIVGAATALPISQATRTARTASRSAPAVSEAPAAVPLADAVRLSGRRRTACDLVIQGDWQSESFSLATVYRRLARAAQMAGARVGLTGRQPFHWRLAEPGVQAEVDDMLCPPSMPAAWRARALYALGPRMMRHDLAALRGNAGRTIIHTMLERDALAPDIVDSLKAFAGIWLGCEWNRRMLIGLGLDERRVLSIGVPRTDDDPVRLAPKWEGLRPARAFGWIGACEPRKRPHRTIKAFAMAFPPDTDATLTMKMSVYAPHPGWHDAEWPKVLADPEVQARGWTAEAFAARVRIIFGILPRADVNAMLLGFDCYVTGGSEGFDMPACDAKLAGRRMIYAVGGAAADFADPAIDLAVESEWMAGDPVYEWEPGAGHPVASVLAMVVAMRRAYDEPVPCVTSPRLLSDYSMLAVGRKMLGHCALLETLGPP